MSRKNIVDTIMNSMDTPRQRVEFHVNFALPDDQYPTMRKTSPDRIRESEAYALSISNSTPEGLGPSVYFTGRNYQAFEFLLDKTLVNMKDKLNELFPDYASLPDAVTDSEAVNIFIQEYGSMYEDVEIIPAVAATPNGNKIGIRITNTARGNTIVMSIRDASRLNMILKKIEPNVFQLMLISSHIPFDMIAHF